MRSKIEANEYKDYILGFIFYKYLSDKEVQFAKKEDFSNEEIKTLSEEDAETVDHIKSNIGYFIAYDHLFSTWIEKGKDFDENGQLAASGKIITNLLDHLNRLAFYNKDFPKSLGREDLERDFLPLMSDSKYSTEDKLATACEHIAMQISSCIGSSSSVLPAALPSDGKSNAARERKKLCSNLAGMPESSFTVTPISPGPPSGA
jgi:hypothetical protein